MNYSTYRFTLDIHQTKSQVSIPIPHMDTAVQFFINLTDGGKPYKIAEGCTAKLFGKKADDTSLIHDCDIIDDGTRIHYKFTDQTATALGKVDCEIRLFYKNGLHLSTPIFVILVEPRAVKDDDIRESETELSALDRIFLEEEDRTEAEEQRVDAEKDRLKSEEDRKKNELERIEADKQRDETVQNVLSFLDAPLRGTVVGDALVLREASVEGETLIADKGSVEGESLIVAFWSADAYKKVIEAAQKVVVSVPNMSEMDKMMFAKFGTGEKDYFFSQGNWDFLQNFNRAYVQCYDSENDLRLGDDGKGLYALRAICRYGKETAPSYPWMKKTDWVAKYRAANPGTTLTDEEIIANHPPKDTDYEKMATIIERRPDGAITVPKNFPDVSEDIKDGLAVPKKYADAIKKTADAAVKKLDCPDKNRYAYTTYTNEKGESLIGLIKMGANPTADVNQPLIRRRANGAVGTLKVPQADDDAASKYYTDNKISSLETTLTSLIETLEATINALHSGDVDELDSRLDLLEQSLYGGTEGLAYVKSGSYYVCTGIGTATNATAIKIGKRKDKIPIASINQDAFKDNDVLENVTIPDSITSIGESAFADCSDLTIVAIGNGVTTIKADAFKDCKSLIGVHITDLTKWCAITFANENSNPLANGSDIYYCGILVTDLIIPDGVANIGANSFCKSNIKTVSIPDSVQRINENAFGNCTGLTEVTIPNSVTFLGTKVFNECTSLESVTIGSGVTSIGEKAFYGCTSLTEIDIPDSVSTIYSNAFSSCSSLKKLTIGKGVSKDRFGIDRVYGLTSLKEISVSGDNADYKSEGGVLFSKNGSELILCPSNKVLTGPYSDHYTIPDGVTKIGAYAFAQLGYLSSIYVPSSVTSIGANAFKGESYIHIYVPWSENAVGGAPWGATNATIHYDYTGPYHTGN